MNQPRRREVSRFIHVDSRDFADLKTSQYKIEFGKDIPIQDYNNVIKLELKAFVSERPNNEDYVIFKIKNIDGCVDSTTSVTDAATVCYFFPSGKKPIYFGGNVFNFYPPISTLSKLEIDILKRNSNGSFIPFDINTTQTNYQSFLLKITYIEGNLY